MTRAFISKFKPAEYWTIDMTAEFCAIHTGVVGTPGDWQLQEYLDEDIAAESYAELIKNRPSAGFAEDRNFDPSSQIYLDDPEFGPHELTSHPAFRTHFTDPLYLDVVDEESPFGSDNGAEMLEILTEAHHDQTDIDLDTFAESVITSRWEMAYHPPQEETDIDYWAVGGPSTTDQALIALAFGTIKISGSIRPQQKDLALAALRRWQNLGAFEETPAPALVTMINDLDRFPAS